MFHTDSLMARTRCLFSLPSYLSLWLTLFLFVYYRYGKLWPLLRNKISTPLYTVGNSNFCPTQVRSSALPRNREDEKPRVTASETRALFVTAHPDDECMFFAHIVLKLVESHAALYLLCLSTGNYNNQGLKRELLDSCAVLGIPSNRWKQKASQHPTQDQDAEQSQEVVQNQKAVQNQLVVQGPDAVQNQPVVQGQDAVQNQPVVQGQDAVQNQPVVQGQDAVQNQPVVQGQDAVQNQPVVQGQDTPSGQNLPFQDLAVLWQIELPDDPAVQWSTALISSLILKHIPNYSISVVLTFDGRGVSGHANHIAIYKTLRHLASAGRLQQVHVIADVSLLFLPQGAMLCHRSQLLWFRRFYILFSRYMFVNTFQAITVETKNVKIY
ncbi:N-acetylglucosaminyl-phosphatidylinositol de-N-acetylase-like [Carassius carassius]|uniref:N-acetylglucosaminyl-phosphatidylinositol de-N-acetylase-like n=1 Tax=Carassius carassius TaxID=217509 RepID=UPI0028688080|nr:N-acetylglucosaminyl-phosphatidylinositol de-N-acetylase-like [Carassius carassius]